MKTIYFFISLILAMYSHAGTLKDVTASCGYAWYGFGSHQSGVGGELTVQGFDLVNSSGKWVSTIRAIPYFNHRMFVDNWIVVPETTSNNQTFTLKTEPTEQNFKFDSFFKLQKANGLKNIWSASGCFDWYDLGGKSQRKTACYDPRISPSDPKAWLDLAHLCKLIAIQYNDNGLLDYIQVLNEWDFRWNVPYILKPQEYAVGFRMCYNAIRSVSPKQGIMIGATLNADMATAKLLMRSIDSVFILNGETPPRDIVYTVNNYIRTGDNNQGNGVGATPETVDRYNVFFKPLNDFCKEIGIKYAITETGYNSSPSNSASALKNKAPSLEGYTLEEAQGILDLRIILQNASLSECIMVCLYHCKDGYEAEPFTYHGLNYDKDFGGKTDWSAKPARTIIEAYLSEYGAYNIDNFRQKDQLYGVDLIASTDTITLIWTDRNKSGEYDAKPRIGKLTTPNQSPIITLTSPINAQVYTAPAAVVLSVNASDSDGNVARVEFKQNGNLIFTDTQYPYTYTVNNLAAGTYTFSITAFDNSNLFSTINNIGIEVNPTPQTSYNLTTQVINGKRRIYWSDGQQAILSHADSPEGGLNPSWQTSFADLCRSLPKRGINTITVTLRGDDVTSIFPFTTQGGTTPDRTKMNLWKYQLSIFINECKARNLRPIIIAYIGERTNFNKTLAQYQSWLSVLADVLKSGEDISGYFIFGIEEIGQSWSDNQVASWWNPLNSYIKSVMPKCLTMLHNNPGKKFWRATSPVLQVDMIDIQETSIGNMEASANDVLNRGYAAHLHEWYGAIKVSQSEATNLSKLNQQLAVSDRIGCKCSAVFASDYDTQRPDTNKLKSIHQAQSNYLYGNIVLPPDTTTTPSNIEIRYSASYTRSPSVVLNNGTTVPQGSYWLFSNVAVNWELKKGTSVVKTTTNSLYLNGNSNTYFQRGYTYTLTTTNTSGTKVITFVVN